MVNPLLLGVVTFPLSRLNSGSTGPGAMGPGAPLSPATVHCLWEFAHNHTLSRDTPLEGGVGGGTVINHL